MKELEALERKVPIASDKALIDLVNGIHVSRDVIAYQKNRGFFGQLFDQLSGSDKGRQILLSGNLLAGQETLRDWVLEITDSLRISQSALELTQNSLLGARAAIRNYNRDINSQKQELLLLDKGLSQLNQNVANRLAHHEEQIRELKIRVAAKESFDQIIAAWKAGQTYGDFPWAIQVVMLIKEVFSGVVLEYELQTDDKFSYRNLLINEILAESKGSFPSFFSVSDLMNWTCKEFQSPTDLQLALSILEVRSLPYSKVQNIPFLFTLATTLELSALPGDAKPLEPAHCAIELCHSQVRDIGYTTDMKEFISHFTNEFASNNLYLASSYRGDCDEF